MLNLTLSNIVFRRVCHVGNFDIWNILHYRKTEDVPIVCSIMGTSVYWSTDFLVRCFKFSDKKSIISEIVINVENTDDSLYVTFIGGEIVKVILTPEPKSIFLGNIGHTLNLHDIQFVSWSPNRNRVVFVASDESAVVTTSYFEICSRFNVISKSKCKAQRISVGWAKPLSKKVTAKNDDFIPVDGRLCISWRGDSSMFVMTHYCQEDNLRKFRIFSKEGVLLYVSDDADFVGLVGPVSWQPSGRLIATVQILPNKKQVISFLEGNTIQRGGFGIPSYFVVKDLLWSTSSDILLVWCIDISDKSYPTVALLYMMSNCKWYLKQQLTFRESVLLMQWDKELDLTLHVLLHSGEYRIYNWTKNYVVAPTCFCKDHVAFIASIDGENVIFTRLALTATPPPAGDIHLNVDAPVDAILFSQKPCSTKTLYVNNRSGINCNSIAIVTKTYCVTLYNYLNNQFVKKGSYWLKEDEQTFHCVFNWFWDDEFYFSQRRENSYELYVAFYDEMKDQIVIWDAYSIRGRVATITEAQHGVLIQLVDRNQLLYDKHKRILQPLVRNAELLLQVCCVAEGVIGISATNKLYWNGNVIAHHIASFHYKPPFLILVTVGNLLIIYMLDGISSGNKILCRKLDGDLRFVTSVKSTLLFQALRGNFESFVPHSFVLHQVDYLLTLECYNTAFRLLKKQHISYNILYDCDKERFLEDIVHFVECMSSCEHLMPFIDELDEKDYTLQTYRSYYQLVRLLPNQISSIDDRLYNTLHFSHLSKIP